MDRICWLTGYEKYEREIVKLILWEPIRPQILSEWELAQTFHRSFLLGSPDDLAINRSPSPTCPSFYLLNYWGFYKLAHNWPLINECQVSRKIINCLISSLPNPPACNSWRANRFWPCTNCTTVHSTLRSVDLKQNLARVKMAEVDTGAQFNDL